MKTTAWLVPIGVLGIGLLVYLGALAITGPEARTGIAAGVALGCAFQLFFLLMARLVFPGKHLAAYGVGMLGRLLLVVVSATLLVPATGFPAAPTLLSLVTVLFATTLLEPVALAVGTQKKS
ncbi:MAG TPA: hypothetical protein VGB66_16250 [Longimicrobium sp.]